MGDGGVAGESLGIETAATQHGTVGVGGHERLDEPVKIIVADVVEAFGTWHAKQSGVGWAYGNHRDTDGEAIVGLGGEAYFDWRSGLQSDEGCVRLQEAAI